MITVRRASEADAAGACDALRRSIRELCVADHGHDEEILAAWLANKTPDNVRAWIASPASFSVVAVDGADVRGFALIQQDGEIQMCYLVPEAQHRGAGKLMLQALEQEAMRWGLASVFLTSSITAKAFYERNGYVPNGAPKTAYGVRGVSPMTKRLAPDVPIACTLTGPELREREETVLKAFGAHVRRVEARPDGYLVEIAPTDDAIAAATAVIQVERLCCAFLRFDLTVDAPMGRAYLTLSGPPGTRELLEPWLGRRDQQR